MKTASAAGERQMFPMQMKRTRIFVVGMARILGRRRGFDKGRVDSTPKHGQVRAIEAYTSLSSFGRRSLTTGADWYRPDDDRLSLRVVEHPCHVKRMQTFICQHAVRSRGLIAVTESHLTPDGVGFRKSSGWVRRAGMPWRIETFACLVHGLGRHPSGS